MTLVHPSLTALYSDFEHQTFPFNKVRFLEIIFVLMWDEGRRMEKSMYAQIYAYIDQTYDRNEINLEDALLEALKKENLIDSKSDIYEFAHGPLWSNFWTRTITSFVTEVIQWLRALAEQAHNLSFIGLWKDYQTDTPAHLLDTLSTPSPFANLDDAFRQIELHVSDLKTTWHASEFKRRRASERVQMAQKIRDFIVTSAPPLEEFAKWTYASHFLAFQPHIRNAITAWYLVLWYDQLTFFNFSPFTVFRKEGKYYLIDSATGRFLVEGAEKYEYQSSEYQSKELPPKLMFKLRPGATLEWALVEETKTVYYETR